LLKQCNTKSHKCQEDLYQKDLEQESWGKKVWKHFVWLKGELNGIIV